MLTCVAGSDRKLIATCFVEFNGKLVASAKKGFKTAVGLARLHPLRHTAATRPMQQGVPIWEAAAGSIILVSREAPGNAVQKSGKKKDTFNGDFPELCQSIEWTLRSTP